METFEYHFGDDIVHLHQDNWRCWRNDRLSVHPGEGKWRFDLELANPREILEEVPVINERVHARHPPHTCLYECSDWSTIYGVYGPHGHNSSHRMIVESQNPEPLWGERITLLASSTYFKCEPWETNVPNQFAYFRGWYWQVTFSELLYHEFPAGVGYPLRDNRGMFTPRRGGEQRFLDAGYIYTPYVPLFNTPVYGENRLTELYGNLQLGPNYRWNNYPKPEFKLDWRKYGF